MKKENKYRFMPLLMALCVVLGIMIGSFYANHFSGNRLTIVNNGSSRLNNLLRIIDDQYVDKVNIDSLVDKAIPTILSELDPHSVYISAKDAQAAQRIRQLLTDNPLTPNSRFVDMDVSAEGLQVSRS